MQSEAEKIAQRCPRAPEPFNYCPDCDGSFPCQIPKEATMATEPDMTDDWMNPPKRERKSLFTSPTYPRFLILRQRRLEYHPFSEWATWASFDTKEARDEALDELRKKHPAWHLDHRDELFAPLSYN